jgi:hypothetical protein
MALAHLGAGFPIKQTPIQTIEQDFAVQVKFQTSQQAHL